MNQGHDKARNILAMESRPRRVDDSSALAGQDSIALIVEETYLLISSLVASSVYATQYHYRKVQPFDKTVARKTTIGYRSSTTILGHRRRLVTPLTSRLPRALPADHRPYTRERYSLVPHEKDTRLEV